MGDHIDPQIEHIVFRTSGDLPVCAGAYPSVIAGRNGVGTPCWMIKLNREQLLALIREEDEVVLSYDTSGQILQIEIYDAYRE